MYIHLNNKPIKQIEDMARYIKKYYSPDSGNKDSWMVAELDNKANESGEVDLKGYFVERDNIIPFDWGEDFLDYDEVAHLDEVTDGWSDLVEVEKALFDEIEKLYKKHSAIMEKAWKML